MDWNSRQNDLPAWPYRPGSFKVPAQYKGLFPRILAGSNPGGIGHHWVKETFVDRGQYNLCKVVNDEGGMLRQFIPAKMQDNPSLTENDPDYVKKLEGLGEAMKSDTYNV